MVHGVINAKYLAENEVEKGDREDELPEPYEVVAEGNSCENGVLLYCPDDFA